MSIRFHKVPIFSAFDKDHWCAQQHPGGGDVWWGRGHHSVCLPDVLRGLDHELYLLARFVGFLTPASIAAGRYYVRNKGNFPGV